MMALTFRSIFTNKNSSISSSLIPFPPTHFPKKLNSPVFPLNSRPHLPIRLFLTFKSRVSPLTRASASSDDVYGQIEDGKGTNVDDFLSAVEFLSLTFSAAISLYAAVSFGARKGGVLGWAGNKVYVWQCAVIAVSVVVGAVIRRRQWRRVCGGGFSKGANLLSRVEKLEEDLRSSATLIRVLSRQLEKLGIRVRDTRKALKDPISQVHLVA